MSKGKEGVTRSSSDDGLEIGDTAMGCIVGFFEIVSHPLVITSFIGVVIANREFIKLILEEAAYLIKDIHLP